MMLIVSFDLVIWELAEFMTCKMQDNGYIPMIGFAGVRRLCFCFWKTFGLMSLVIQIGLMYALRMLACI